MNTKYGKLVQLSSGWCQDCSSRIDDTTWCFVNGTTNVEARHIVEAGLLTQKELDDLVLLAAAEAQ